LSAVIVTEPLPTKIRPRFWISAADAFSEMLPPLLLTLAPLLMTMLFVVEAERLRPLKSELPWKVIGPAEVSSSTTLKFAA